MTARYRLPLRRWLPLVIAAVLGLLVVLEARRAADPVYYTQVNVRFLPPARDPGNVLEGDSDSLIHFAAVVERAVNSHHTRPRLASPAAPLYGRGIREGESAQLIDRGGQWRTNFNTPALSVEVVAETEAALHENLDELLERIAAAADAEQSALGVPPEERITTALSPSTPVVSEIGGRPSRAMAVAGAVTLLLLLAGSRAGRTPAAESRSTTGRSGARSEETS